MYQHILVPIDGSETSKRGLEEAIRLAQLTKGQLRLIHLIDDLSFSMSMGAYAGYAGDWLGYLRESGERIVAEALAQARAAGVEAEGNVHENSSQTLQELVAAEARKWPADLIVLGTHGRRGVGRMVMGSGAESIVRHAPVPVLLVRAPETAASS